MSNPIIRLKKSGEKDKAPASLAQGEVAVNYNAESPALYIEDSDGNVIKLADGGVAANSKVQSVTGEEPIVVITMVQSRIMMLRWSCRWDDSVCKASYSIWQH